MDGLIIDSEPYWRKAMLTVFANYNLVITEEDCAATTGLRFDNVVDYWFKERGWNAVQKNKILQEVLDQVAYYITHFAEAKDGFYTSMEFFKSKGYQLSIASSSAMQLIEATIEKLNIRKELVTYISAEKLTHGKPHPEVFLVCAEALLTHPNQCLVLEDSVYGVIAANAAQMNCIAIPEKQNLQNPKFSIADETFPSLSLITSSTIF